MAIKKVNNTAIGNSYSYIIDSELDRHNLPHDVYFYEQSSKKIFYKESKDSYLDFWEYKNYTDEQIASLQSEINNLITSIDSKIDTLENLGTGEIVTKEIEGTILKSKTLIAGSNISLSSDENEITISSSGGGVSSNGYFPQGWG